MRCADCRDVIGAYADGELTLPEQHDVRGIDALKGAHGPAVVAKLRVVVVLSKAKDLLLSPHHAIGSERATGSRKSRFFVASLLRMTGINSPAAES